MYPLSALFMIKLKQQIHYCAFDIFCDILFVCIVQSSLKDILLFKFSLLIHRIQTLLHSFIRLLFLGKMFIVKEINFPIFSAIWNCFVECIVLGIRTLSHFPLINILFFEVFHWVSRLTKFICYQTNAILNCIFAGKRSVGNDFLCMTLRRKNILMF